jgi:hypothetical protein
MFKILIIITAGNSQRVTTQVIEFDGMNAAIAAANAINKHIDGQVYVNAICLW